MREIKFRFWNKVADFMMEWKAVPGYTEDQNAICSRYIVFEDKEFIPLQYTGLIDKNGKEIYEGDILKVPVDINQEIHGNCSLHEVKIKKGLIITSYLMSEKGQILPKGYTAGFLLDSYEFDNKTFLFNDNPSMETRVEVIGNVYENPELLEEKV